MRARVVLRVVLALATAGWASCSRDDDVPVDDGDAAPACRTDLTGELGRLRVPGLSAAIIVDGQLACTAVAGQADIEAGRAVATPQAAEGVTYAKKLSAKFARLDWTKPGRQLDSKIRGYSPSPGAWFELPSDKGPVRVKALLSQYEDEAGAPGVTLDDRLLVGTGEGAVRLLRVQREGRGPQAAEVFLRGNPVPAGTRLG